MEGNGFQEHKSLVNEITKGMQQVKQLRASSFRNQETVLERMLASYEEALSILNGTASEEHSCSVISSASDPPDSSLSVCKVTQSKEVSSCDPRTRKLFSRLTEQITVTSSSGEPDDGYPWRKYGQKDILGSKYPRSYYRCPHRLGQGCMATKQVQRSDDDPNTFVVTYRGKHTCFRIEHVAPQLASMGNQE